MGKTQKANLNLKKTYKPTVNCSYVCAYHCAQLSYTTQHGTVLIILLDTRELIFTARRSNASAVLGVIILSVCPSVTRVLCD